LEVGSWELADLKELQFWNLNLETNTTPDFGTLNFATKSCLIASFDSSFGMNCQTEIDAQILICEDEKVSSAIKILYIT